MLPLEGARPRASHTSRFFHTSAHFERAPKKSKIYISRAKMTKMALIMTTMPTAIIAVDDASICLLSVVFCVKGVSQINLQNSSFRLHSPCMYDGHECTEFGSRISDLGSRIRVRDPIREAIKLIVTRFVFVSIKLASENWFTNLNRSGVIKPTITRRQTSGTRFRCDIP